MCTASSSRNAQLSQLDLVFPIFNIPFQASLHKWGTSLHCVRFLRKVKAKYFCTMPVFPHFWHPLPGITSQGKYIVGQGFSFFSTFLIPPDFQSPCPLQSQVSKVRNAPHRAYWGVDGQNYKYLTFLSTWITNLRRKDCIKDVKDLSFLMENLVKTPLNVFRTVCQGDKWKP